MDLQTYKEHTVKVEAFMADEVQAFEQKVKELTHGWHDYDRAEYYENVHDQYWDLCKVFPNIQRQSELMSIYTILENTINRICSVFESSIDNPVKLEDLQANGIIDKGKRYLEKVVRIQFPSSHPSWVEITNIQTIRNSFVHANGLVKTGNSKLLKYIKKSEFLELDSKNIIQIKNGFSVHCLDVFSSFVEELFTQIISKK